MQKKVKWFKVFQYITNRSIKYYLFSYTLFIDQTILFLTIHLKIIPS